VPLTTRKLQLGSPLGVGDMKYDSCEEEAAPYPVDGGAEFYLHEEQAIQNTSEATSVTYTI